MQRRTTRMLGSTTRGFTLIELLVVVAIIAILISFLLPSLKGARDVARQVVCSSQQRQIHIGMELYRNDYNGWGNRERNGGFRFELDGTPVSFDDPDNSKVYWGITYDEYIDNNLSVWQCPDMVLMDPWPVFSFDYDFIFETQRYQSYGLNGVNNGVSRTNRNDRKWDWGIWDWVPDYVTSRTGARVLSPRAYLRPTSNIVAPSDLIVFQDAWEHNIDNNGDALNELSQYDRDYGGAFQDVWRNEYFRHGDVNVAMFADGAVRTFSRQQVSDEGNPKLLYNYTGLPEDKPR